MRLLQFAANLPEPLSIADLNEANSCSRPTVYRKVEGKLSENSPQNGWPTLGLRLLELAGHKVGPSLNCACRAWTT
jgi:hypothetical protein